MNRAASSAAAAAIALVFSGCATPHPDFAPATEASLQVLFACPPLFDLKRHDTDALRLRVAEVEQRYEECRLAATAGTPGRAPRINMLLPIGGARP